MKQPETFADRLNRAMGKRHTGQAVADALGVRAETVSGWRNGKTPPGDERMEKLAAYLGVSAQWLRYGDAGARSLLAAREVREAREVLLLLRRAVVTQEHLLARLAEIAGIDDAADRAGDGLTKLELEDEPPESQTGT